MLAARRKRRGSVGMGKLCISMPVFVVDSFTDEHFSGNPAAVCIIEGVQDLPDFLKQDIAAEFNLSETAFVTKLRIEGDFKTDSEFGLRWFTPTNEVSLCGHATLAAAAVLFNE
ncbi:unnamed protein product [Notodromas monacha]|uniref:Phenazine biosynthesis-like domain-containing protein 1 n=1 Tax=Notodromas monacha TaxID=399045 RepID=A0A7R9BVB0_9CRUS|nr:unnamed protein product [Notodromas monacha]CAG0921356.1 unnamed protein product [Notodromas monacha]